MRVRDVIFSLFVCLFAAQVQAQNPPALQQLGQVPGVAPGSIDDVQGKIAEIQKKEPKRPEMIQLGRADDGGEYLVIREDQLDRPYLFSATLEKGTGENDLFSATAEDTFLWSFHRVGDHIQFLRLNVDRRAVAGTPESKMVENSFPHSIVTSLPYKTSEDGHVLYLSAKALFLQDILFIGNTLAKVYPDSEIDLVEREDHRNRSALEQIESFPNNMEIKVQLLFERGIPKGIGRTVLGDVSKVLADSRHIPITMRYSLTCLPQDPSFESREADPRVPLFKTTYQDFSRPDLKDRWEPNVHLTHRWNLRKKDPSVKISDVVKPIEFWLENTIPEDVRPIVKEAILAWNAAFDAVGLRNALVVREVGKDPLPAGRTVFDPADAAYNVVVRWFLADNYARGFGPSRVNPLTGEIFNASIQIGGLLTRMAGGDFDFAALRKPAAARRDEDAFASSAIAGLVAVEARGGLSDAEKKEYLKQFLSGYISHETGHVLGLAHNFRGGSVYSLDEIGKDGLIASTQMHYPVANVGLNKRKGPYWQVKLGPSDFKVVEYNYAPLPSGEADKKRELKKIADEFSKKPVLAYGSDADAYSEADPDVQRYLLGNDPVAFARKQVSLVRIYWDNLAGAAPSAQEGDAALRNRLSHGFIVYERAVSVTLPVIGGTRSRRSTALGERAFTPVPASEQRRALDFLDQYVFSSEPFKFPAGLLSRLSGDRLSERSLHPYPLAEDAYSIQKEALNHIYNPATLSRLRDNGQLALNKDDVMTTQEVFKKVSGSIWKELGGKPGSRLEIPTMRRTLQRKHLTYLGLVITKAGPSLGDAHAAAWRDLTDLFKAITDASSSRPMDEETRLHLRDMRVMVKNVLVLAGLKARPTYPSISDEPN